MVAEKSRGLSDHLKGNLYIAAAFITVFLFFHPLLFSQQTLYFRDIQAIFYPMKYFLSEALKSGSIPFWCPMYFCGAPFLSDIQTGVFYPPSLLFIMFSYPLSFNLYVVLHIFLCFCFIYLWGRGNGLSVPASIFSAIAYSYGGYVLSSINLLNNLTVITWLPAMLWAYQKALSEKSWIVYALTVFFLCLAILGGEPQLLMFSVITTFCFGLFLSLKRGSHLVSVARHSLIFLTIVLSSLLLTIVQWGPTFFDYQNSVRLNGFNFQQATEFSLSWDRLKHLLIPVSFSRTFGSVLDEGTVPWLLSIYPGLLVAPLALVGFSSRLSREKIFWMVLFLLGTAFALGRHTPLYNLVHQLFPYFRFPEKFYFLSNIGLVVLAGYGFDRLMSLLEKQGVKTTTLLFILPLLLFVDLYLAHAHLNPTCKTGFYQFADPALRPVLQDQSLFRLYVDEASFYPSLLRNSSIAERQIIAQAFKASNSGILQNLHYVDGKTGMELQYQWIIGEILLQPWPERIKLLQWANAKYIVSASNLDAQPGVMEYVTRVNPLLFQLKNHLPRAWLVGEIYPSGQWTLQDYNTCSLNARASATGPEEIAAFHKKRYYQDVDHIVYEKPHRIRIDVAAGQPGVLVLAEAFYPGWRATVNGKPKNIVRLNYLFQGVEVEAGRQSIIFEYRPPFFQFYAFVSIAAIVILTGIGFICFMRQRKKRPIHERHLRS
jgi:hypothetical protein